MKDLLDAPLLKLVEVIKKYTDAVRENDILELHRLKIEYSELFSDEFRQYIRDWLHSFSIHEWMIQFNEEGENGYMLGPSFH